MLVGPSGSGKTTAMRLINRLIPLSGGEILLGGRSVLDRDEVELRREIGYVIQQIGLFPHHTVAENIATVPRLLGWGRERIAAAHARAARADRHGPAGDRPALSGGAVGRAAPARRRRPGAGRRSAAAVDGRAVRRDRPDQPSAAPGRVPGAPGARAQDRRVRDPRHRRGDQDGRPRRGPAPGRHARPVRDARRAAVRAGGRVRRAPSSAPTAGSSGWASRRSPTSRLLARGRRLERRSPARPGLDDAARRPLDSAGRRRRSAASCSTAPGA